MKAIASLGFGCLLMAATGRAQTYNLIFNFYYAAGANPSGVTVIGNTLYGATPTQGGNDGGTVFKLNTDGSGFTLLSANPGSKTGFTANGTVLYGTLVYNLLVAYSDVTNLTVLQLGNQYQYLSSDWVLRGNTLYATASRANGGYGYVLKVNTDGTGSAVLRTFINSPDGATPEASLVCAGNTLYGTTSAGGKSGNGTVFKLNTDGTGYAILCNFSNTPDGASPQASLCLNGSLLYGTTANGGSAGDGTIFVINTNGTGYAVLKNFTNSPDGANPRAGLLWAGNTLYGTTSAGGSAGDGTLFQINPDGTGYTVLHHFLGYAQGDGSGPSGNLVMGNGTLYGTTFSGGTNQNSGGTIFSCTPSPPPLRAGASGNLPVLFWPNDGFNHPLQTTTNLNSGTWTTVTNGAPVIGVLVTNAPGQGSGFFRLH